MTDRRFGRGPRPRIVLAAACALVAYACSYAHAQTPEFRAYWVDAWHNGFKTAAQCDQLIADVQTSNCNVVVVQMRRRGDTYYPSAYEPFASDADPSFDVLRYLLDRCHAANPPIQVHAWLVWIPVWNSTTLPSDPNHPVNKYPEFLSKNESGATWDGGNYQLDPGNPDCEEYLNNLVVELATNYPDLDGINYDYSRFSGSSWGYNDASVARFNARHGRTGQPSSSDPLWGKWVRDQHTNLIRKTYASALAINPSICMSSAVVTWHPCPDEVGGDFTLTRPYYQCFQDWDGWMREGILDLSMPMCYFDADGGYASDYDCWMNFAKAHQYNRGTAIGPGVYMNTIPNSISQIRLTRQYYEGHKATGVVLYSYASTNKNQAYPNSSFYNALSSPSGFDSNPTPVFNTSVPVPSMPWRTEHGHLRGTIRDCGDVWFDGANVQITGPEGRSMATDGTGFYAFIDLDPGLYTVTASYPTKATKQLQVEVVAGQVATADFNICPAPPVVSNVRSESIGQYAADIKWSTDQPSTSQVEYGLTTYYGSVTLVDDVKVLQHAVPLSGLDPGAMYHYRVRSTNAGGGEAVSGGYTFTTAADPTPPVIADVQVTAVAYNEALVTWTTDDPSTSQVEYGLTASYGQATTEDAARFTQHMVFLSGLESGTTYHFRVKSSNGGGLTSYSGDGAFTTMVGGGTTEIIVDDSDAAYTQTSPDYMWTASSEAGGWPTGASSFRYVNNSRTSTSATCTWTPNLPVSAAYDVYVWYAAGSDRTSSARYTIAYAGGTTGTIYVDQRSGGSQWVQIASGLQFDAGASGYVQLINRTGETSRTTKLVADAVKFVTGLNDTSPPSVPANVQAAAISTSQISLAWSPSTDNVVVFGYKVFRGTQLIANVAGTSFTDSGLQTNSQYTYRVSAYDSKNNESAQSGPVSRHTLAVPSNDQTITCDRTAGTWYKTSPFTFSNPGFGIGKASYYQCVWDNSPTHDWTGTEETWMTPTRTENSNSGPQAWYFHARSMNYDDQPNGSVDKGPYYFDGDPPSVANLAVPRYIAIRGASFDSLSASWSGSDTTSGIGEYTYAIGSAPGATDILNWTSSGTDTSAGYHPANAPWSGRSFYWTVKARDLAGNWSEPVTSGASVYANAYGTISAVMNNPDATAVIVDADKIASGVFAGGYYVQEPDRTRGLRVEENSSRQVGDRVRVGGRLASADGERRLTEVESTTSGGGSGPVPLAVKIAAIGGAAPDVYTQGLNGSRGCYNIGLLVRTTGRVIQKDAGWFMIGDGSGATVKVYSSVAPPDNAYVGVTGVASVESETRVIRTRASSDVTMY